MKKNIVFTGVMGAILLSVGAANAALTVASTGYVDNVQKNVEAVAGDLSSHVQTATDTYETKDNAGKTYETKTDASAKLTEAKEYTDALEKTAEDTYQTLENKVVDFATTYTDDTQYPSAKAVQAFVNEKTSGIASDADLSALKTAVGDANSGLVKDVVDLGTNKQDKLTETNFLGTDGVEITFDATNNTITIDGTTYDVATAERAGLVKIGAGISVADDGTISVTPFDPSELKTELAGKQATLKNGDNITLTSNEDGTVTISAADTVYTAGSDNVTIDPVAKTIAVAKYDDTTVTADIIENTRLIGLNTDAIEDITEVNGIIDQRVSAASETLNDEIAKKQNTLVSGDFTSSDNTVTATVVDGKINLVAKQYDDTEVVADITALDTALNAETTGLVAKVTTNTGNITTNTAAIEENAAAILENAEGITSLGTVKLDAPTEGQCTSGTCIVSWDAVNKKMVWVNIDEGTTTGGDEETN